MKGKILNHDFPGETGMYHLQDNWAEKDGRDSIEARKQDFPVGSEVKLIQAHNFGSVKVYRAYIGENRVAGRMNYFNEKEVEVWH